MRTLPLLMVMLLSACFPSENMELIIPDSDTYVLILGVAQDAGYPQAGCIQEHCMRHWRGEEEARYATSIAVLDKKTNTKWLFEATPDFKEQLHILNSVSNSTTNTPDGIFLTHAHMGHYTGLMHVGHESMGASNVPVYAMPRMHEYLSNNGPWSQLVNYGNISLQSLTADSTISITEDISVTPLQVPHRDEYSETVGYLIEADKKVLFIPDINKWDLWETDIRELIKEVDYAFLDATFYDQNEIPNRDMSEFPHPFVIESMNLFEELSDVDKAKVHFIHFNHSNPLIFNEEAYNEVKQSGYNVARQLQTFAL